MTWFAASQSGQADALHSLLIHGGLYGGAVYVGWRSHKRKLSAGEERELRIDYSRWNIRLIIFFLLLLLGKTVYRVWHPIPMAGRDAMLGIVIGLLGTITSLVILSLMARAHGWTYASGDGEGRGRGEMHEVLSLDTVGDFWLSFTALATAFANWKSLLLIEQAGIPPHLILYVDPFVTFVAVLWIGWKARTLWAILGKGKIV